jgi:hypothetical protein
MKITVLGQTVSMEGVRVIRKEVKVYTEYYLFEESEGDYSVVEKRYLPIGILIDKINGKTFEGEEFEDYVEVDLNKVVGDGI